MSSESDSEFEEHECPQCKVKWLGKNMWPCGECNTLICEACDMVSLGCEYDDVGKVCQQCFRTVFHGHRRFCYDADCRCDNKSPRFMAARQRETAQVEQFKRTVDVAAWKQKHQPIDYPSIHKGKHLIDLFLSNDSFEHGYIAWLVKAGSPAESAKYNGSSSPSFINYVQEARSLLAQVKKTRLGTHDLRH